MLQFTQNNTTAVMILTLTEKVSITTPYYLFHFTHVLTKDTVSFVKSEASDESTHPIRYNKFTIDASVLFLNKQPGEWHYKVYEQVSAINTVPEMAGEVLEYGKMILDRSTDFSFTKYDQATTFKTYNG